jgi:hypothetical protein
MALFIAAGFLYFSPLAWQTNVPQPAPAIPADLPTLKTGDMVFIQGRSFLSEQLRKLNPRDQRYSHCGWLVRENGQFWVYHLSGQTGRPPTPIRRVSLRDFIAPGRALAFGIYRSDFADTILQGSTQRIKDWQQAGVTFDYQFDLGTDDKMYCSELIFKALKSMEDDLIMVNLGNVNGKRYVTLDNLYFNPQTSKVFDYAYY